MISLATTPSSCANCCALSKYRGDLELDDGYWFCHRCRNEACGPGAIGEDIHDTIEFTGTFVEPSHRRPPNPRRDSVPVDGVCRLGHAALRRSGKGAGKVRCRECCRIKAAESRAADGMKIRMKRAGAQ